MQNAEMKFVTFDAQDVTAPSGNPAWFRITGTGNWEGFVAGRGGIRYAFKDDNRRSIHIFDSKLKELTANYGQCYKVKPDKRSYVSNKAIWLCSVEAIDSPGSSKNELASFNAVLKWFMDNRQ